MTNQTAALLKIAHEFYSKLGKLIWGFAIFCTVVGGVAFPFATSAIELFFMGLPALGLALFLRSKSRKFQSLPKDVQESAFKNTFRESEEFRNAPRRPMSTAEEIVKLDMLRKSGVLTTDEFAAAKSKLLA